MPEVSVYFEWRDAWIGVYWNRDVWEDDHWTLKVYICLVPCLPIRLTWTDC